MDHVPQQGLCPALGLALDLVLAASPLNLSSFAEYLPVTQQVSLRHDSKPTLTFASKYFYIGFSRIPKLCSSDYIIHALWAVLSN